MEKEEGAEKTQSHLNPGVPLSVPTSHWSVSLLGSKASPIDCVIVLEEAIVSERFVEIETPGKCLLLPRQGGHSAISWILFREIWQELFRLCLTASEVLRQRVLNII